MGNLGSYQTLTTMSKKVGGPKKLVTLLVGGGVVLGVTIEKSRKYIDKKKKELLYKFKNKNYSVEKDNIYIIIKNCEINKELKLEENNLYRILECDGDVALIELIGNDNNPYIASKKVLENISEKYKGDKINGKFKKICYKKIV